MRANLEVHTVLEYLVIERGWRQTTQTEPRTKWIKIHVSILACPASSHAHNPEPTGSSICAYGIALAEREMKRFQNTPKLDAVSGYRDSSLKQIHLLETAIKPMQSFVKMMLLRSSKRQRYGTQIYSWAIYVSETGPSNSVYHRLAIDSCAAFMQADWPVFLKPKDGYVRGFEIQLTLPDNFDELLLEEKDIASYQWKQEKWAKAYELSTFGNNKRVYHAMNAPRVLKELFLRRGST